MKLIKASYEIITPIDGEDILKQIELVARTCYQSECKITEDDSSAEDLIRKLINRGHEAMLEFGYHPIFIIDKQIAKQLNSYSTVLLETQTAEYYTPAFVNITQYDISMFHSRYLVSGSIRAYRDLLKLFKTSDLVMFDMFVNALLRCIPKVLIVDILDDRKIYPELTLPTIQIKDLSIDEKLFHQYETVRFICDRGVSHELVRHRVASFAQESTRYCNYGKDESMQFIIPCWFNEDWINNLELVKCNINDINAIKCNIDDIDSNLVEDFTVREWCYQMVHAEISYTTLLSKGWSPQQARSVLPNSLKTEINMSANLREWRHIMKLRTAKGAHPQMRELMYPLLDEFKTRIPILFDDINY